jgi:ABC-type branched-subunit amino acid transport system permease subunit
VSIPAFTIVQGVVLGLNYGLLALGLVLIYRTSRVLNFAQGQLGVVGAVFLVKLYYDFGINYWAAVIAVLLLAGAAGAVSELVLRRIFNRPRVLVMVATIGLSQVLFLFTVLPFIRPRQLYRSFPVPIHVTMHVGSYLFQSGDVLTLIVAPLAALALAAFVRFSPWGLAMRAMAENTDSARLSGVWVRRTSTVAWTLAGVLSAITAILASPGQTSALTQALSPGLLLRALTAALIGAMVSLPVAFIAGIGIGIVQEVLVWNVTNSATIELILFALLLVVLLVRVGALQKGARSEERSSWKLGVAMVRRTRDTLRDRVGTTGVVGIVVITALLPLVVSTGRSFLLSQICIYAVIALSLTVLTGWAGQVSLGQFGLVAVGSVMAAHLGNSVPLLLLLPFAGVVTALLAVVVGLPALRVRGLYLAVSTLGFALFIQASVLATPCWTVPLIDKRVCTGLPNPQSTLVIRPHLFGLSLASERAFAWFSLVILVLSVLMVRVWRDRGVARRLISVRDNEIAAGAAGIPIVRTKLLAFALSGFMAGYAGVCFAFATERFSTDTFDPKWSILVVSMVVIGGLDSVPGAILGAVYLVGLPAIFGTTPTIQFLTSGLGLIAFLLYLPGGLAELMHGAGDLVALGIDRLRARARPGSGDETVPGPPGQATPEVVPEGVG